MAEHQNSNQANGHMAEHQNSTKDIGNDFINNICILPCPIILYNKSAYVNQTTGHLPTN